MFLAYAVALVAWVVWIYAQYRSGDRPVTYAWMAASVALGGFEYGKGLVGYLTALPVAGQAAIVALLLTAAVAIYHSVRRRVPADLVEEDGALSYGASVGGEAEA